MTSHHSKTTYFRDGLRKIDFILVHKKIISEAQIVQINRYLDNLKRKGVQIEKESGIRDKNVIYVKLHAPHGLLMDLADVHNVILTFQKDYTIPKYTSQFRMFKNDMMRIPNETNPVYKRSTKIAKGEHEDAITSAERILLVNYMLTHTRYGFLPEEYGIKKLMKENVFVDAFPLHDGKWEWTEDGPLNDRQILAKYWANAHDWCKLQPIHIINKYYGPEVAFYFAWGEYYTKMLIPASMVGILIFIYGLSTLGWIDKPRIDEICKSDSMMCPRCMFEHCGVRKLSNSCFLTKVTYIFDNWTTVTFAILMSFWATSFIKTWRMQEVNYLYRWNLMSVSQEVDTMPEFEENTPYLRISRHTGALEHYMPSKIKIYRYTISVLCCLLMIVLVFCTLIFLLIVKSFVQYQMILSRNRFFGHNETLVLLIFCSIISVVVITLYQPHLAKLSMQLTRKENQRTQLDYNNSFIIKSYLLACVNNYAPLLYLAFAKEKLFTHPGKRSQYTQWFGIQADICHPSGCLSALTIQLTFLMLIKSFTGKTLAFYMPRIKACMRKFRRKLLEKQTDDHDLPQWELDRVLAPFSDYSLMGDFTELVLQYGVVTFFVAAMPLAPLFALLNNLAELRLDAMKYLKLTRRPIPRRLPGLGAWNGILKAKTYFSTFCNALVIAFTSEMVPRELYRYCYGTLNGFINSTLSHFAIDDYESDIRDRLKRQFDNISSCFYRGDRNSFFSKQKYQLTEEYFYELTIRLCVIVLFEHIIFFLTYILAFSIPDVPFRIKERLTQEEQQLRNIRTKNLSDLHMKKRRRSLFK